MTEFIILLTSSLVILVSLFVKFPGRVALIAVVIIGVGLFLSITRGTQLKNERVKLFWPTVTGQVLDSDVTGKRALRPEIKFSYTVLNQPYQAQDNLLIPGFGSKAKRREVAIKSIAPYPPGAEVLVFYNPDNPAEGYLHVGPSHGDYIGLSFGIFLLIGGLTLIIYSRGTKGHQR